MAPCHHSGTGEVWVGHGRKPGRNMMQKKPTQTKSGKIAGWAGRILAILLGLLAGWLLLELLIRLTFPVLPYPIQVLLRYTYKTPFSQEFILPEQIWQEDSDFQFISRNHVDNSRQFPDPRISFTVTTKNWVDDNSQVGFRVPDAAWEPRWPVDVLAVGDSFTFCYTEYPDCWLSRLEADEGLSVVNLGLVATGSQSHLNVLRTFGLPYEPELVLWQWYGNDFNDDYGFAVQRGEIEPFDNRPAAARPQMNTAVSQWLYDHAAVYRLGAALWYGRSQPPQNAYLNDPYWLDEDGLAFAYGRSYTYDSTDMNNPKNQYGRQNSQQAIREARDMLVERDIPLALLLIPAKEEVYAPWLAETLGQDYLDSLAEGRQQMLAFCAAENLLCLDVTPAFQKWASQGELLYWERDTHLNNLGNRRLAESVADFLEEIGD